MLLGGFQCHRHHQRPRDDCDVGAFALDVRDAKWDREVRIVRHLALVAVHSFLLDEDHRIVVSDGRLQ
jgi:hypothetical protein